MNDRPLVVVTGASGLIGARLVGALSDSYTVVGLDVAEPPPGWGGARWLRCDLTSDAGVPEALSRIRAEIGDRITSVVHLAAYYDFSGEPSPLYDELTVKGTARLVHALQEHMVEQLVFSSTLLVMKAAGPDDVITEDSPVEAEWLYPQSKLAAEAILREERGRIPVVVLRLAGAYDEDGHSPPLTQQMARIYEKTLAEKTLGEKTLESHLFPGNKDRGQPFLHLDDVISCLRASIERRRSLDPYEVLLAAEPSLMTYGELQDRLGELIHGQEWSTLRVPASLAKAGTWVEEQRAPEGKEPFLEPWMADLADAHYPVSIERARRHLGWEPRHTLRDTLPEMVRRMKADPRAFYQENGVPLPERLE